MTDTCWIYFVKIIRFSLSRWSVIVGLRLLTFVYRSIPPTCNFSPCFHLFHFQFPIIPLQNELDTYGNADTSIPCNDVLRKVFSRCQSRWGSPFFLPSSSFKSTTKGSSGRMRHLRSAVSAKCASAADFSEPLGPLAIE